MTNGDTAASDLEQRIAVALPGMTPKQRALARFIADNPVDVAFASAEELGNKAGVDSATVVRFSQHLGYEGFVDLRLQLRRNVPRFLKALDKLRGEDAELPIESVVSEVFRRDVSNLEETAQLNKESTFEAAGEAICKASSVHVLGQGRSAYVGGALAHQLALMGLAVRGPWPDVGVASVAIEKAEPTDVVLGIALWRYHTAVVRTFERAAGRGLTTIALTDSRASRLSSAATHTLVAATDALDQTHSLAGLMTLSNVLVAEVAARNKARAVDALEVAEEAYTASNWMLE